MLHLVDRRAEEATPRDPRRRPLSLSRRSFLRIGSLGFGGLSLPQLLRAEAAADGTSKPGAGRKQKGIIMILLPGGPPHLDMYDLKPTAPREVRGEFRPIPTNVDGIEICELMPRMARIMDKLAIVRSLVGAIDQHNLHQCLTGWESHPAMRDSPRVPGYPEGGWPSISAAISRLQGTSSDTIPASISLAPEGAIDITRAAPGQTGYLGMAHAALEPNEEARDDFVLNGVSPNRIAERSRLLKSFDQFRRGIDTDGTMKGMDAFVERALGILTSSRLAEALDLDREDSRVRARYGVPGRGDPEFGGPKLLEQFLLARRVIEAGARCVTVVFSRYPLGRMLQGRYNWDWHSNNFKEARGALPFLDQGVSALVEDLDSRGLLDDVSVVVWGEFGRTPRINQNAGRDHWPQVGNVLLAGGGMRTGQVIGATNHLGEYVTERPVHFREVFATLYHNMGIDVARTTLTDLSGRPHFLVDNRRPIAELV